MDFSWIDWKSLFTGVGATLIIIVIAIMIIASLIMGKVREQLKYLLTKYYSRLSLVLIALMDVVAAFDPTQLIGGIGLGTVTGILVFVSEWVLHDRLGAKTKGGRFQSIMKSLAVAVIAGLIILIPYPITGIFIAWFGVLGDKKRQ
jgi:hypothetical protein